MDGADVNVETAVDDSAESSAERSVTVGVSLRPGDRVGRYLVLERIGHGGMGVVYCAFDPQLNRRIALKLLRPSRRSGNLASRGQTRLLREAQAMARLSHPNVIAVHDVGTVDGTIFVAMEFVEGRTLSDWLEDETRTPEQVIDVMVQAGKGLAAAHAHGLVHRDFKPDNVMVGDDGRVRVLDFGLARTQGGSASDVTTSPHAIIAAIEQSAPIDDSESESDDHDTEGASSDAFSTPLTRVGAVMGTPAYMSPEQHLGMAAGAASDQFSYCISLYRALFDTKPFEGSTVHELAINVTDGNLVTPPSVPGVSARVRAAVQRGLSPQAEDRWPSMDALVAELAPPAQQRRRRWIVGAVMGVAAGVAVTAFAVGPGRGAGPCQGAAEKLAGVWDDARRAEIAASLEKTNLIYAGETWQRVEEGLDAYAGRWIDGHTEACEATRVRAEQSESLLDARMRCLADRRRALSALTDALVEADAVALEHAVESVEALPSTDACADPDYVTARLPPPDDPEVEHAVESLHDQLARSKALHDMGRYAESLEIAAAADARAKALEYPPIEVEAALALGTVQRETSDYDEAEASMRRAYFEARTIGHDEIVAEASTRLVPLLGERLKRTDEALWWSEHARAENARWSAPKRSAALEHGLGDVYFAAGKFDEARAKYELALDMRRRDPEASPVDIGLSLDCIGRVDYRLGEYDQAIESHEQALAVFEKALGPDHPQVAETLSNLANVHYRQKRLDQALEIYERVLALRTAALGEAHAGVAVTLNNIGNIFDARKEPAKALELYERALGVMEKALGNEHPDLASVLANVANCHESLGDLDKALELHRRALEIKRAALGDVHHSVGYSHNGIGTVLFKKEDYEGALASYRQALEVWEGSLGAEHLLNSYAWRGIAKSALELGRYDEAIEASQNARKILIATKANDEDVASPSFLLARALWAQGKERARSRELAQSALAAFEAADEEEDSQEVRQWLARR